MAKDGFDLVFHDEFDGTTLDPDKWLPYYLPHWTDDLSRTRTDYTMSDGILTLQIPSTRQGWSPQDPIRGARGTCVVSGFQSFNRPFWHDFSNRQILTHYGGHDSEILNFDGFSSAYGYWEMRLKMFAGEGGGHFSWWAAGDQSDDVPRTGNTRRNVEIDIVETKFWDAAHRSYWERNIQVKNDPLNVQYSSLQNYNLKGRDVHTVGPYGSDSDPNDLTEEFHIYAMHWTPYGVEFYFDNTWVDTAYVAPRSYAHGMVIALYTNCGSGRANGIWPKTTEIDYVRVYASRDGYVEHPLWQYPLQNRDSSRYMRIVGLRERLVSTITVADMRRYYWIKDTSNLWFVRTRNGVHFQIASKVTARWTNAEVAALRIESGRDGVDVAPDRLPIDDTTGHWKIEPVAGTNGEWFRIVNVADPTMVLYENTSTNRVQYGSLIAAGDQRSHWRLIRQGSLDLDGNSDPVPESVRITDLLPTATVSASELTVTEAAGGTRTATYTVKLNSAPSADVTVTPASSVTTAATVSGALTFTATDYATPQTVTVTGVDDPVVNASDRTATITHAASGGGYDGVSIAPVTVTVTDDERAGVTVSKSLVAMAEAGGTATYTVGLDAPPSRDVTVTAASGDTSVATVSPGSLTFTRSNYLTPQTVTVTGVDDAVDNPADRTATITHAASGGGYDGTLIASVTATARDDDGAGEGGTPPAVSVSTRPFQVNEGETATLTLSLSEALGADAEMPLAYYLFTTEEGDFEPLGSITVPAGSTAGTGEIETNQDADEDDEVFYVSIDTSRLPASVREGDRLRTHIGIIDDDRARAPDAVNADSIAVVHNGASLSASWDAADRADTYDVTYYATGEPHARAAWERAGTSLTITCDIRTGYENRHCVSADKAYSVGLRAKNDIGESGWVYSSPPATYSGAQSAVALAATTPVDEGSTSTVTATLTAPATADVTIPLSLSAGEGTDRADFGALAGIAIAAGQSSGTGTVATNHDADRLDETFTVALGALPDTVTAGTPSSVTVMIDDDDALAVSLAATTPVAEGSPTTVTATLAGALSADATIPLVLTPGKWADRGDFGSLASVTVAAGSTSGSGALATNHDADAYDETFTIAFGALPDAVTAGTPTSVTVTITDDETRVPPTVTLSGPSSVNEGDTLTLTTTLSDSLREEVTIPLNIFDLTLTDVFGANPSVTVGAGAATGSADFQTAHDDDQSDEQLLARIAVESLPDGVRDGGGPALRITVVDDDKPQAAGAPVWLLPSASQPGRGGMVRVVNRSGGPGAVAVTATDDAGRAYPALTLRLDAGATAQFDSQDLEAGNPSLGLTGSTGPGAGDWRLEFESALDIEALAYARSAGGFVSALDATAPAGADGALRVALFNPAGEHDGRSLLRLVNPGGVEAAAVVAGIDDAGNSPGSPVRLVLAAGAACTVDAGQLESGAGLPCGARQPGLGDGVGRWRLAVSSDAPLVAMNLLAGADGRLSNLSGVSAADADGVWHVPLFPPASEPSGRQGLVRVINRSQRPGKVSVTASDDGSAEYAPLTVALDPLAAVELDADDLELGDRRKGLAGTGAGVGAWRLSLSGDVPFDAPAYVRGADGFLTAMRAAPSSGGVRRIALLAPDGGVPRLVNDGSRDALVTVAGTDDLGASPGTAVRVAVPAGAAVELTAAELESGDAPAIVSGALGDGDGGWRLAIGADGEAVSAMSLLPGPMGGLTNLSGPLASSSATEDATAH